ncbi:DUF5776 domain-containing protein [Lentilactobacillus sp.]|uniref:DUF5776 domain-containing protein n=1 Tax=Lentilactobacillus sp. TaxID=2767931 RepID=UPI00345EB6F3
MKKKQFVYWISLILGLTLLFAGGSNVARADTSADVDSAIASGVKLTAQKETLDAWDAAILATSDNGITDAQAQNAYNDIVTTNYFLSGEDHGYAGVSNVAGVIGLRALGKDPTNINKKDLVGQVINDPLAQKEKPDLYTLVNDLEALSTGSYGKASEKARASLTTKLLAARDSASGIWKSAWGDVDPTGRALQALSMNTDQPGVPAAISKAVAEVESHYYQPNGGFGNQDNKEDQYNNITMVDGLAAAGVDVYTSLNNKADYKAPVQRLLDQKDIDADSNSMLLQQATYTLEQAKFTKDGGQGWIFNFEQNPTFRPRELAKLNQTATAQKQVINGDTVGSATDKATAISQVNQILESSITKINADTSAEEAIADRAVGIAAINNVKIVDSNANSTSTAPTTINNNYTTIISSGANSSSSASSASSQVAPTPQKKHQSIKGSVVYGLTKVKLYKTTHFTKSNLIRTYQKQPRTKRPMFLVISQTINQNSQPIYKLKNLGSGKTGYALAGATHFSRAYYSAKVIQVKVINPKGINEYGKVKLTDRKHHVKKNALLAVKQVVKYGRTTRLRLANGCYVSANKKMVFATRIAKAVVQNTDATATPTVPTSSATSSSSTTTQEQTTPTTSNGTATLPNNVPTNPAGNANANSGSNTDSSTETVTVTINANGSVIASGSVTVSKGKTALDALNALASQHNLSITTSGSGSTAYVKGIDGYNAGPAGTMTGWLYAVNGNQPNVSIGAYTVKKGDQISLTYNK